jgi:glycosyltransferase involved in cell wall biosynthesis
MRNCLAANGFASESIEVLPYYCRSAAGAEPEGKYVLFAGRVIRQKGIPELLAAAAHFPEGVGLLVAGEGEYSGEARALAERSGLGGRVRFLGRLSPEELGARYAGCLVVAVPSTWGEPFGIIGIEAMANGKPVVAFDVGGIGEWLKDGRNGFLVPRGDAMALAGKISLLCGDRQLRLRFGQEGRRMHEERFTKETHLKRLTDILSGVARKERR